MEVPSHSYTFRCLKLVPVSIGPRGLRHHRGWSPSRGLHASGSLWGILVIRSLEFGIYSGCCQMHPLISGEARTGIA